MEWPALAHHADANKSMLRVKGTLCEWCGQVKVEGEAETEEMALRKAGQWTVDSGQWWWWWW
jgi:hypothetical protein